MPKKYPWQRWPTKNKKKKKKSGKKQAKYSSWGKSSIQDLKARTQITRGKVVRLMELKKKTEKEKQSQRREQPPAPLPEVY